MGPLSGLIVAPVVGVLSDRCTSSFGRRRPFMLGGVICCIIGMNIFANAKLLTLNNLFAARMLAIIAFGILDFSTNAIMFPSRALMSDLLPADQQHAVQSAAAVVASIAEICAGVYLTSWKNPVTHISRIFMVASVLLAISSIVSLVVCVEEPLKASTTIHADEQRHALVLGANPDDDDDDDEDENEDDDKMSNMERAKPRGTKPVVESTEVSQWVGMDADALVEGRRKAGGGDDDDDDADGETDGLTGRPGSGRRRDGQSDEDEETRGGYEKDEPDRSRRPEMVDIGLGVGGIGQVPVWRELLDTVRSTVEQFPRPLIKVGVVYGLAWLVWFASLPFYSQWLGTDVLKGDPHAQPGTAEAAAYQRGVSVFSVANVVKALLAMVFSAFYPTIIKWVGAIGERVVFGVSFAVFSVVLFVFASTSNVVVAACVIALGSVPFIVTQTIPIAIVVQRYPDNVGSNLGVMNLFCVVPQLLDTIYTGKVAKMAGEWVVLRVAAVWGMAAAVAAFVFL